jgi:hypothetical protein
MAGISLGHPIINDMLHHVTQFLLQHPLQGTDDASLDAWRRSCDESWTDTTTGFFTEEESTYASSILATLLASTEHLARHAKVPKHSSTDHWSTEHRRHIVETLLLKPQVEQRTAAWYTEAVGLLSASQFSTILKPGRTRGQLVLQKAHCDGLEAAQRKTVVKTEYLNPFTWGIRFEPVVKQIYQALTGTCVVDLGRLRHPTDNRLAASPDGLIVEGPEHRYGRFVEFKAPVSRKILSAVPEDYMAQMQIQMEVGGPEECDYFEVKFHSDYAAKPMMPEPEEDEFTQVFCGNLFLISDMETTEPIRYEYSPLNDKEWVPTELAESEFLAETIPWWSSEWFLTTVGRSRTWFASVQPAIEAFWVDVENAKQGLFTLPPSTRVKKDVICRIQEEEEVPQPLVAEESV